MSLTYNGYLQRNQLTATAGQTTLSSVAYAYNSSGRLETVTEGDASATYSYVTYSPLVSQIFLKQNTTTRLTRASQYDFLNRVTSVSAATNSVAAPAISHAYQGKNGGQRIRSTEADGSYWLYDYDSLGQVTSGKKYWADGTPVAGQQFEYAFDQIGNRTQTKVGGNAQGGGLRKSDYTANYQNQYSQRTLSNRIDVLGVARANATVAVNGVSSDVSRKREYFHKALQVTNGTDAQITVTAARAGFTSETNKGHLFIPASPETFTHDAEGNLTQDGKWNYVWDFANRLISMETLSSVPTNAACKLLFAYDFRGRRISKKVYAWNTITLTNDILTGYTRFVYDGWNLIATLSSDLSLLSSFCWGTDLSGTEQGAGGVSGLLHMRPAGGSAQFAFYDGNGNLVGLTSGSDGSLSAQYQYGPFGEAIRISGNMATNCPFRFSTKYCDDETDLVYYGFRYYRPSKGRWLSRDPIQEQGGQNVYAFLINDTSDRFDRAGLDSVVIVTANTAKGDAIWWKLSPGYGKVYTGIKDTEQLLLALENHARNSRERIDTLNISGHGYGGGISYGAGDGFHTWRLTDKQVARLRALLADGAEVRLWGCQTAAPENRRELQELANRLNARITGNAQNVASGPDRNFSSDDLTDLFTRWLVTQEEQKENPELLVRWLTFVPAGRKGAREPNQAKEIKLIMENKECKCKLQ
jgi:RHS repeat-associated protein